MIDYYFCIVGDNFYIKNMNVFILKSYVKECI